MVHFSILHRLSSVQLELFQFLVIQLLSILMLKFYHNFRCFVFFYRLCFAETALKPLV